MAQTGEDRPSGGRIWVGAGVGLVVGAPILAWGLLTHGRLVLDWFVPLLDGAAIVCMLVTLVLAWLDVELRRDRRSLPITVIAVATSVMWAGHLLVFPGVIPGIDADFASRAALTLFLLINVATPLMLGLALFQSGGPLRYPRQELLRAAGIGAVVGLAVVGVALVFGPAFPAITAAGDFTSVDAAAGAAGLVPVLAAMGIVLAGRRGDERIAAGVLAALTFSGLESIAILLTDVRYSTIWYAAHMLAFLPFAALLASQLRLYSESVRVEIAASESVEQAARRMRTGLDVAEAMATQAGVQLRIERLLRGALEAVKADRASLLRIEPEGNMIVEAAIDDKRPPAPVGWRFAIDDMRAGDETVLRKALAGDKPLFFGAYKVSGLPSEIAEALADIRYSLLLPLKLGNEVDSLLLLARRSNVAFTQADVELLQGLSPLAALQLRNARLLADAEAAAVAKSSFLNLAAHELRTPITVMKGYLDMLHDGTLGRDGEQLDDILRTLQGKAQELSDHVERMLMASRLDAEPPGARADARTPALDLSEVAEAAVDRARPRATLLAKTVSLLTAAGPIRALGRDDEVGIILDNLLNNAMTYSSDDASIIVEAAEDPSPLVRVVDNGIGIPAQHHRQIFEQFSRVDSPSFGYPAGTGLGLYISRRLAELQGGSLDLEWSEPGSGSSFVLRLRPVGQGRGHEPAASGERTSGDPGERRAG